MPTVVIADPSLVVLIGAAGSGKSSFAARRFAPDEILSSDAIRERISGDAADQTVTRTAFRILHDELRRRLAARRLTVVDATNVVAADRRQLLRSATSAGVEAVAIALDLAATVVHARNASRLRVVDPGVVDRQLAAAARSLVPGRLEAEGFAPVIVLRTPSEVDALTIVRRRTVGA